MTVIANKLPQGQKPALDHEVGQDSDWWRQASVYQIYPRSFYDANGDGIGDFRGVVAKVPYLESLGIDAAWLSPFYPSPLKDGGYEVSDYCNVDPRIGSLQDFDDMIAALKSVKIKVIIDIVPNHASNEHLWFQEALKAGKGSKERARLGPDKLVPPSDWQSIMGGPAWSPSGVNDGQFYLHMYDSSQPDLNWSNPEVRHEFERTLRFWGDRGVSGFRVDVASGCMKDLMEPMEPWSVLAARRAAMIQPGGSMKGLVHPLFDRDETLDIWREWRSVLDEYEPPLSAVVEAWVAPERKKAYAAAIGQAFAFDLVLSNFDAEGYKKIIKRQLSLAANSGASTTWVLSNHDVPRHHTRYGLPYVNCTNPLTFLDGYKRWLASDGKDVACNMVDGLRKGRAATLMILALPGSTYLYQGEELGLPEVPDIPDDKLQDPYYFRNGKQDKGRDGCRVPLPWTKAGFNFGNGDGEACHLPQPATWGSLSVEAQSDDTQSTLNMYRQALALRRKLHGAETLEWIDMGEGVLAFERPGGWLTVMNGTDSDMPVPLGDVFLSSGPSIAGTLPSATTVWIKRRPQSPRMAGYHCEV